MWKFVNSALKWEVAESLIKWCEEITFHTGCNSKKFGLPYFHFQQVNRPCKYVGIHLFVQLNKASS